MTRQFRWAVTIASVLICLFGIARSRIFTEPVWDPTGLRRFLAYSVGFAAVVSIIFLIRRKAILPCFALAILVYAGAMVGPRPVLALLFFLAAAYWIGRILLKALRIVADASLAHCLALVAGCAVWGFIATLLAFTPLNFTSVFLVLLILPAAGGCLMLFRAGRESPRLNIQSAGDYWSLALFLYAVSVQFLMALKPEVSADGIAVHLAAPLYMLQHHQWHFDVGQVTWAVMAMEVDWTFTTLFFVGGEYAAKLLPFAFLVINSLLILLLCRTQTSRNVALLVATIYTATPIVQLTTGALFTDNLWIAFLLSAAVAVIEATRRRDSHYVALCGIFLGAALATKLVTMAFFLPCVIWMLAACFFATGSRMLAALRAFALLALVAAPPFITSLWKTGSPVYPFLNAIFKSPLYDTSKSFDDARFKTPLSWHVPYDLTFHTSRFLEGQDGGLGLAYLFVFFLLFCIPRSRITWEVGATLALAAIYTVITFETSAYARYLIPGLVLLLFAFAACLQSIRQSDEKLFRLIVCMTVAMVVAGVYLLPSSGYWHKGFCLDPTNFKAEAAAYVETNAPSRVLVDYLNRTAPNEPVAFFTNGIAGLNARAYSTGLHNFTFYRECLKAQSAVQVNELMARTGIRHFVTPLPNCGSPPLPQLSDFLAQFTRERFRVGCLYVADLKN